MISWLLILLTIVYQLDRYDVIMNETFTNQQYKVVVVGATGATGAHLFAELIKAKEFSEIVVLGRRPATIPEGVLKINLEEEERNGRVKQHVIDFEKIDSKSVGDYFEGAHAYISCLGSSRRQAGSADMFRHIDYDYNINLAKVAREKNVRLFMLVSSQGANENSFFLYPQVKGQIEKDCRALAFQQYAIFRPGFLHRGKESRVLEKFAGYFLSRLPVETLARALCSNALQQLSSAEPSSPQEYLYYNDHIIHMSETHELNQ